tara:strand:+ start:549 stop:1568 length:1020 start_codon:yes stop_codon:yes gene_type:complete
MEKKITLTGITTTGTPHLGNYVGAIRPAVISSHSANQKSFFFLADYHALIKNKDKNLIYKSTTEIAASWLALGLNTDNAIFYRQSDIPEIAELTWILNCVTSKGLMNRSHAYKSTVQTNIEGNEDADFGVTMGLFSYPVLMAADILLFKANTVPVGRDQIQHVEMARDIAQRFNHLYGQVFQLPEVKINQNVDTLVGLDGRKMSKSYNNIIPIFASEKQLKKNINKIKTNLLEPGQPKDPDDSLVFQFWKAFAHQPKIDEMRDKFQNGISWGEAKKELFVLINNELAEPRDRYNELMSDPEKIESYLIEGASKAREISLPFIKEIREAVGINTLQKINS